MRLRWSPRAQKELEAVFDYIAEDNPEAALRWILRIQAKAEAAVSAPLAARVVPELERRDVREVFLRSYRIVYRVFEHEVYVLTVFEGHRQFPDGVLDDEGDTA